jgi:hypothetical protein
MTSENEVSFMNIFAGEKTSTRLCRGCRRDGTKKLRHRTKEKRRKNSGKEKATPAQTENDLRSRWTLDNMECATSTITQVTSQALSVVYTYERSRIAESTISEVVLPTAISNVLQYRRCCARDAAGAAASAAAEVIHLAKSMQAVADMAEERSVHLEALNKQLEEAEIKLAQHAKQLTMMEKKAMEAVAEAELLKENLAQHADEDTDQRNQLCCSRGPVFMLLATLRLWSGCVDE